MRFSSGPAAGADLVEDHRGGAADREAGRVGRQLVALPRVLAAFLQEGGEAGERGPVAAPRVVAGGVTSTIAIRAISASAASSSTRARERRGDPLRPGLARGRLEGAGDVGDEDVEDGVVGLEEALRLVLEHLVEALAGDSGDLDHVGDRGRLVALRRRHPHHRLQQPLPLRAHEVGARQILRASLGLGRIRGRIHEFRVGQCSYSVQPLRGR